MHERLLVFSDAHGCHVELRKLLAKVEANPDKDSIWAIGDMFDRAGPDCAMKVWEVFQDYKINYIWGNHDGELGYKIKNNIEIRKPWYKDWWNSFNQEAKDWFMKSEKYYHFDWEFKVLLVHAGVNPVIPYQETDSRILCTIQCIHPIAKSGYCRLNKENGAYYWPKWLNDDLCVYSNMHIVFGHTVHHDKDERYINVPKVNVSTFNIDWGAVHGGSLACYINDGSSAYFEAIKSEKDYYKESYGKK